MQMSYYANRAIFYGTEIETIVLHFFFVIHTWRHTFVSHTSNNNMTTAGSNLNFIDTDNSIRTENVNTLGSIFYYIDKQKFSAIWKRIRSRARNIHGQFLFESYYRRILCSFTYRFYMFNSNVKNKNVDRTVFIEN